MKTETVLIQFRNEQREVNAELSKKLDALITTMTAHVLSDATTFSAFEAKLAPILSARRTISKLTLALAVALIGIGAEGACNHIRVEVPHAQVVQAVPSH
jgi:hypothetical protein